MSGRSDPQDAEAGVVGNGGVGGSSTDITPTAPPSPSGSSSERDTSGSDLAGHQIGQIVMQAFSRLFQNTNEETIIDAELAHKALDLDRHELDLIDAEAQRDHQRKMQEIKVVSSLAIAALIVILIICGLVAWRAPDKLLRIVISTVTATGHNGNGQPVKRLRHRTGQAPASFVT